MGLYCREVGPTPEVLVHTYSSVVGATERVQFMTGALIVMVGLEHVPDAPGWLRFPCKSFHERALKRAFLDLCKLESNATLEAKPLTAFDKKAGCHLAAVSHGRGVYHIEPEQKTEAACKRAAALALGFVRLCEMQAVEDTDNRVSFRCEAAHDGLMGMLMFRAQNLRGCDAGGRTDWVAWRPSRTKPTDIRTSREIQLLQRNRVSSPQERFYRARKPTGQTHDRPRTCAGRVEARAGRPYTGL